MQIKNRNRIGPVSPAATGLAPHRTTNISSASVAWPSLAEAESALLAMPSPDRFRHYQATVRRLMEQGLKHLEVREETYRSPRGQFRRLTYLTRLDQEMEALRQALWQTTPAMALLQQFDAVRGILLDLWT